jgi:ankyrin repeat protein
MKSKVLMFLIIAVVVSVLAYCSSSTGEIKNQEPSAETTMAVELEQPITTTESIVESVDWNKWREVAYKAYDMEAYVDAIRLGADCPTDEEERRRILESINTVHIMRREPCDYELLCYFIDKCDIDPNTVVIGLPMLNRASAEDCLGAVECLVEKGADVNTFVSNETSWSTPLMAARSLEVIRYLVEHGAEVNLISSNDQTKADSVWGWGNSQEREAILNYLYEHGADRNHVGRLFVAIVRNFSQGNFVTTTIESLEGYINEGGFDINTPGYQGKTALDYAMEANPPNPELIELLQQHGVKMSSGSVQSYVENIRLGADCPTQPALVESLMSYAVSDLWNRDNPCDTEDLCFLLDRCGYDANMEVDSYGEKKPLLITVSEHDCLEGARCLVNHGADVNVFKPYEGGRNSPLLVAKSLEMVQFLVEQGAEVDAISTDNLTRADWTYDSCDFVERLVDGEDIIYGEFSENCKEVFDGMCESLEETSPEELSIREYLVSHGADRNHRGRWFINVANSLGTAGYPGGVYYLKYQVEHGVDVNTRGYQGKTALDYLLQYGGWIEQWDDYAKIVDFLRQHGAKRGNELP